MHEQCKLSRLGVGTRSVRPVLRLVASVSPPPNALRDCLRAYEGMGSAASHELLAGLPAVVREKYDPVHVHVRPAFTNSADMHADLQVPQMSEAMSNEAIVAALKMFYSKHNPSLVPQVPRLIARYAKEGGGGEDLLGGGPKALVAAVWKKWLEDSESFKPEAFLNTQSASADACHWVCVLLLAVLLLALLGVAIHVLGKRAQSRCIQMHETPDPDVVLMCPITHELMLDPVVTAVGSTYERQPITIWLRTHSTDPLTNRRLTTKALVPNQALRSLAVKWVEEHPNSPALPSNARPSVRSARTSTKPKRKSQR